MTIKRIIVLLFRFGTNLDAGRNFKLFCFRFRKKIEFSFFYFSCRETQNRLLSVVSPRTDYNAMNRQSVMIQNNWIRLEKAERRAAPAEEKFFRKSNFPGMEKEEKRLPEGNGQTSSRAHTENCFDALKSFLADDDVRPRRIRILCSIASVEQVFRDFSLLNFPTW